MSLLITIETTFQTGLVVLSRFPYPLLTPRHLDTSTLRQRQPRPQTPGFFCRQEDYSRARGPPGNSVCYRRTNTVGSAEDFLPGGRRSMAFVWGANTWGYMSWTTGPRKRERESLARFFPCRGKALYPHGVCLLLVVWSAWGWIRMLRCLAMGTDPNAFGRAWDARHGMHGITRTVRPSQLTWESFPVIP